MFDVVPDASTEPVALRLFLRARGQALSETWPCDWTPRRWRSTQSPDTASRSTVKNPEAGHDDN